MERLKQLTEKLNMLAQEGASRETLLELGFDVIRQLIVADVEQPRSVAVDQKKIEIDQNPVSSLPSLNDSFQQSSPDLSQRLQQLRLGSLKSSMGINDRYLFIETLFKGDAHSFDTMMGLLDEANNFQEAERILFDYVGAVPMGTEHSVVIEKFQELLKRRFSAI